MCSVLEWQDYIFLIHDVFPDSGTACDLGGRKLGKSTKGINIIRMSDGTIS